MTESENKDRPLNLWLLIVLALLAAILLTLWRLSGEGGSSLHGTSLHGSRLMPPRVLSDMVLVDVDNQALPATLFKGQWSYVVFAESDCDDLCRQQLLITRQSVDTAAQAQRVLVLAYEPAADFTGWLKAEHPDVKVAVLTRSIWAVFVAQFLSAIDEIGGSPYFLVNPNGLVVAGYDELVSAADAASDFRQLVNQ